MAVYVCIMWVPEAPKGQKKASDSLQLELLMVVNYHVRAGN